MSSTMPGSTASPSSSSASPIHTSHGTRERGNEASSSQSGWVPIERRYGIAVFPFAANGRYQISLNKGDVVQVVERNRGWYKGYLASAKKKGIFPVNYVELRSGTFEEVRTAAEPLRSIGLANGTDDPLIHEMIEVLREWGVELKKLIEERRNAEYDILKKRMSLLVDWRKKLMTTPMTQEQREEFKARIIKQIEEGGKMLDLDMIVRVSRGDRKGQRADEENSGIIELFSQHIDVQRRQQAEHSRRAEEDTRKTSQPIRSRSRALSRKSASGLRELEAIALGNVPTVGSSDSLVDSDPSTSAGNADIFYSVDGSISSNRASVDDVKCLLLQVKDVVNTGYSAGDPLVMLCSLYSHQKHSFVSEFYGIEIDGRGVPSCLSNSSSSGPSSSVSFSPLPFTEDLSSKLRTVFKDLSSADLASDLCLLLRVYRIGRVFHDQQAKSGEKSDYYRPFAIGIVPLYSETLLQSLADEQEWQAEPITFFTCSNEANFTSCHDAVIDGNFSGVERLHRGFRMTVSFTLYHGRLESVIRDAHGLRDLLPSQITEKIGFPDVIHPTDMRNDLYIFLDSGIMQQDSKSVEVQAQVFSPTGAVIPGCILRASGIPRETTYRSAVFYHVMQPHWNECIRISLDRSQMEGARLVIALYHVSLKPQKLHQPNPFAIGVFRISEENGLMRKNGTFEIPLCAWDRDPSFSYIVEKSMDADTLKRTYGDRSDLKFRIRTTLVSTRMTQEDVLNCLLRWKNYEGDLPTLLEQFTYMEFFEIVKFLREIFDSLFHIMMSKNDRELNMLVFNALVFIIGQLVDNRRFGTFRVIMEQYIDKYFSFSRLHGKLLDSLAYYLDHVTDTSLQKQVRACVKALHYLFKFAVRSKTLFEDLKASVLNNTFQDLDGAQQDARVLAEEDEFREQGYHLLQSLCSLMRLREPPSIVAAQDITLKHIGFMFEALVGTFSHVEIGNYINEFIASVQTDTGHKNVVNEMLRLIEGLCRSDIISHPDSRSIFLPVALEQFRIYSSDMQSERERYSALRVFIALLDSFERGVKSPEVSGFSCLFPYIEEYLLLVQYFIWRHECSNPDKSGKARERMESFILSLSSVDFVHSSETNLHDDFSHSKSLELFEAYVSSNPSLLPRDDVERAFVEGITGFLAFMFRVNRSEFSEYLSSNSTFDSLRVVRRVLDCSHFCITYSVYPHHWFAMLMLQYRVAVRALVILFEFCQVNFVDDEKFSFFLWQRYLALSFDVILSPQLQLESMSLSHRDRIISKYGDLRVDACKLLKRAWSRLDSQQFHFVPSLVDPILRVIKIEQSEIAEIGVSVYYQLLLGEYRILNDIRNVARRTDAVLDDFTSNGDATEDFQKRFIDGLETRFQSANSHLQSLGFDFIIKLRELVHLIQMVQQYRIEDEDERTEAALKCMGYLKDNNRKDLFFKYVHILVEHHNQLTNFVEAGNTLLKHAEMLVWDRDSVLPAWRSFPEQTEWERKLSLFETCVDLYEKGRDYERGLKLLQELASLHQSIFPDYNRLGRILRREADLYEKIISSTRCFAEYFRVAYYGAGFAGTGLRDMSFIYRGYELEPLQDFQQRIAKHFPNAEILSSKVVIDDSYRNSPSQFIQIQKVLPSTKEESMSYQRPFAFDPIVPARIRKYNLHNDVDTFSFGRIMIRVPEGVEPVNDLQYMYRSMTFYTTRDHFPTTHRRSPIVEEKSTILSPIQVAIRVLEDKNDELQHDILGIESRDRVGEGDWDTLSMHLNGACDAQINGGPAKYRDAFLRGAFVERHPELSGQIVELRGVLKKQLDILRQALACSRKHCSQEMLPFQELLEGRFIELKEMLLPHLC